MNETYRQKTIQMCDTCREEPAEVLHRSRAGASFEQYEALCKACARRDEPDYEDSYMVGSRDEMDGDHESALASAGFGTDEDYGG